MYQFSGYSFYLFLSYGTYNLDNFHWQSGSIE